MSFEPGRDVEQKRNDRQAAAPVMRFLGIALLAVLLLFAVVACRNELQVADAGSGSPGNGALSISLGSISGMSLLPDISMDPASYTIRGSGPDGGSFEVQTEAMAMIFRDLVTGTWAVTVEAINNSGDVIGRGIGNATVVAATVQSLQIVVRPLPGPGTLELGVTWSSADVQLPRITAQLIGYNQSRRDLGFVLIGGGSAGYASDDIDAGYYTLALQLRDGETVIAGAVETVRIAEGARTAGSFEFAELNLPEGGVEVVITPELEEPLLISIDGAAGNLVSGGSMHVTASVSNAGSQTVFYAWYVNGNSAGSGPSAVIGTGLGDGVYRLDLIGFSSDGRRFGSASRTFTVAPAVAEPGYDFLDTFSGSSIDTSKWRVANWVEHGGQTGAQRTFIEDGELNLVFVYDSEYYAQTGHYLSSAIETVGNDFGYGLWEARIKPSHVPGVFNAMYTIDWRDGGNMTRQQTHLDLPTRSFTDNGGEGIFAVSARDLQGYRVSVPVNFNPSAEFHVWGVEITPQHVRWSVDGVVLHTYRYADHAISVDAPYSLKFNAWASSTSATNGPPEPDVQARYRIDWVRFTSAGNP